MAGTGWEISRLRASISGANGDLEQRVAYAVGDSRRRLTSPPFILVGAAPPRGARGVSRPLMAAATGSFAMPLAPTASACTSHYPRLSSPALARASMAEHAEFLRYCAPYARAQLPCRQTGTNRNHNGGSWLRVALPRVPAMGAAAGSGAGHGSKHAGGAKRAALSDGAANSVSRLGGRVGVNRFACLDSSGRWQIVRVGNDRSVAVMWRSPDASVLDRLRREGAGGTSGSLGLRVRFLLLNVPVPTDLSLVRGCPLTRHEAGQGHRLPRMRQSTQPALVTPSLSCLRSFSQLVRIENTEQRVDEC